MESGQGLVLVFTGRGKGKTTAALGTVVRALGHGMRVCVVQFIKSNDRTGESRFLGGIEGVDLHVAGQGFVCGSRDRQEHSRAALRAWDIARSALSSSSYGMVVLDEITYPVRYGMIEVSGILEALDRRPPHMHVVLTGRDAAPELLARADLVTEMKEVRHPLAEGMRAQKGIEY